MALFGKLRASRKDESKLGHGLWRRAFERFKRALDRLHQILEGVAEPEIFDQLAELANDAAMLLPRVRQMCVAAQSVAPSDGYEIPAGGWTSLHRELSRAGNSLATAAEALAMVRLGQAGVESVQRRLDQVHEQVSAAEQALAELT